MAEPAVPGLALRHPPAPRPLPTSLRLFARLKRLHSMHYFSRWTGRVVGAVLWIGYVTSYASGQQPVRMRVAAGDSAVGGVRMPMRVAPAPDDSGPRPMRMALPPVQSRGDSARVQGKLVNGLLVVPVSINGAGPFWLG